MPYVRVPQPAALTSDRAFHTMPHKTVTEGKKFAHKNYYMASDQQIWGQHLPQPVGNNNIQMVRHNRLNTLFVFINP